MFFSGYLMEKRKLKRKLKILFYNKSEKIVIILKKIRKFYQENFEEIKLEE